MNFFTMLLHYDQGSNTRIAHIVGEPQKKFLRPLSPPPLNVDPKI